MPIFGNRAPAGAIREMQEAKQKEMRKHVEETVLELRKRSHLQSGEVQKAIEEVRRIDRTEPVDKYARRRACAFLKMYLGQYRVVQAMRDNIEAIYAELEIREVTQEFAKAVEEISGMIKKLDGQMKSPAKLFARLRKVVEPIHVGQRAADYDEMFDGLMRMYPDIETNDASGISDKWLEDVIAGRTSWNSVPETEAPVRQEQKTVQQTAQDSQSNVDYGGLLSSLSNSLRGEK